jgi:hypothetical protein
MGIEGNERADHLAKKAAKSPKLASINGYSSFLYISKGLKGRNSQNIQQWLKEREEKRTKQLPQNGPDKIDKTPFLVKRD